MKLQATDAPERQVLPSGAYPAICYGYIELGTIPTNFGAKSTLQFLFETPKNTAIFDGPLPEPYRLILECSATLAEGSNLRKHAEGWLGRKFTFNEEIDPAGMLNTHCTLLVEQYTTSSGKEANRITSVSVYNGEPMQAEHKLIQFEIGAWTREQLAALPEFVRRKVETSTEFKDSLGLLDAAPTIQ